MRTVAALLLAGCASSRAPPPVPAAPPLPVPAVIVDPDAESTHMARSRVRRHLREIGIRSGPRCVCERDANGMTTCSFYR